jgi:hypothetical protein
MTRTTKSTERAAVGLRVRTGRAVLLALSGPADAPRLVTRAEVDLTDPKVADSKQPFHLGLEITGVRGERAVERACQAARRAGAASLSSEFERTEARGVRLAAATVVSDSATDPASIGNLHMRAHASEGQLFRDICCDAADAYGLVTERALAKNLRDALAQALETDSKRIDSVLAAIGTDAGRPWRADEKLAAMGAWLALGAAGRAR